jgi:hypothetical protein
MYQPVAGPKGSEYEQKQGKRPGYAHIFLLLILTKLAPGFSIDTST